jgi:class 3 adenylate cyclase
VDAERVHLWGSGFGGPVAVAYAAAHPERVDRLVLEGTFASAGDIDEPQITQRNLALVAMLRNAPETAFAGITYVSDPSHEARYDERVRRVLRAIEPDMAERLYALAARVDVTRECRAVSAPTVVLHRVDSQVFPLEASRRLATAIPRASFVGLPGRAHNPWEGEVEPLLQCVADHLGFEWSAVTRDVRRAAPPRTAVLLFTDMVASTGTTVRLGDDAALALVRFHNEVVRDALDRHGGEEVKQLGDGIFAQFGSAAAALRAARDVRDAFAERNANHGERLDVRIGVNAGEPIAEDGDLYGTAVNLAARLCAHAAPGEVLVTSVVRDLAAGKGFRFAGRDVATLKGFDDPVPVFALE